MESENRYELRQSTLESFKLRLQTLVQNRNMNGLESLLVEIKNLLQTAKDNNAGQSSIHALKDLCLELAEKIIELTKEKSEPGAPPRFVDVDFSIATSDFSTYNFDMSQLHEKVNGLFEWFGNLNVQAKYMAPYFPIIQSSGMGKTKLLYELKRTPLNVNIAYRLVLCVDGDREPPDAKVFDGMLRVNQLATDNSRDQIRDYLTKLVDSTKKKQVVLMFDEAQILTAGSKGFAFRAVRWWLREPRGETEVAAIFAGTSSSLSNFYREPLESSNSRKGGIYNVGGELYDPFYDIWTIGCLTERAVSQQGRKNEYEEAIYYGRPLFAVMAEHEKLDEKAHGNILHKMLLYKSKDAWMENPKSCFSILATRVQMGQTHVSVTSELVSKGYAGLTLFAKGENDIQHALMCHYRDPVCARLAMCLMDDQWTLKDGLGYRGMSKSFWTGEATKLFSSQLCYPPTGDTGEVFAALFVLFCADTLRAHADPEYKTFSVNLFEWLDLLQMSPLEMERTLSKTSKRKCDQIERRGIESGKISCIQVCRNYLRFSMNKLLDQKVLKAMYAAGTAYYVYPFCKTIDLFASIHVPGDQEINDSYVPLLISIKARNAGIPLTKIQQNWNDMAIMLKDANYTTGCCLVILLGCEKKSSLHSVQNTKMRKMIGNIECRLIVIPPEDPFGITRSFQSVTSNNHELAELSASHELLHVYCNGKEKGSQERVLDASALRACRKTPDIPLDRLQKFEASKSRLPKSEKYK